MENVLLTGATGFMGSQLVDLLLSRGVRVTHLAPTEELARKFGDRAPGVVCSLDDLAPAKEALEIGAFDTLYHLAWDGVSTTCKNDYDRQLKNIGYGLNVCALATDLKCEHVVIPGSVSEHAYADGPVDGTQPPSPGDAYAAAKAMTRTACELYARQNGLVLTWLLVSSVYGPTRNDANVITYAINALLDGQRPSFTPLEQKWDYLYIDDLLEALCLAGQHGRGRAYGIGSGDAQPLRERIETIRSLVAPQAELGIGDIPYKTDRVDNSIVDISAFVRDTGFHPRISFEEGIVHTISALRERHCQNEGSSK